MRTLILLFIFTLFAALMISPQSEASDPPPPQAIICKVTAVPGNIPFAEYYRLDGTPAQAAEAGGYHDTVIGSTQPANDQVSVLEFIYDNQNIFTPLTPLQYRDIAGENTSVITVVIAYDLTGFDPNDNHDWVEFTDYLLTIGAE